jgi:hypothetical protein
LELEKKQERSILSRIKRPDNGLKAYGEEEGVAGG